MLDLQLNKEGDLNITDYDVKVTDSVAQAINIRLRWFFEEWKFGPQYGMDYFGRVFVKNPNELKVINMLTSIIRSVDEVTLVKDVALTVDNYRRTGKISYTAVTDEETIREEVELWTME